jgi:hypothetical protein
MRPAPSRLNNDFPPSVEKLVFLPRSNHLNEASPEVSRQDPTCSKLWAYTDVYHNVSLMAKFIFSMGNENYRKLQLEAKTRDVTIQALIRTVVIPEWIRTHIDTTATNTHANVTETSSLLSHATGFLGQSNRSLPSVGRSRT